MFNGMAAKKITEEQLWEYLQALIPDNEEVGNPTRIEEILNSVLQLHESGRGANLARGTLWRGFQQCRRIHGLHDAV